MKKFYSVAKLASVAFAICLSLFSTQAISQCPGICTIPIIENFNNTAGGFTGDLVRATQSGNGFLQKTNAVSTNVYTVNTPTFQLFNTETSISYGFSLTGPTIVGTVHVTAFYISTITGQLASADFGTEVPGYCGSGNNRIAVICNTRGLPPGLPSGGRYRLRIELTANEGNGGNNDVIIFDDYRTSAGISPAALPVAFIGFDATKVSSGVQLNWKTAGEENVNHYEVERSSDGQSFSSIGTVAPSKSNAYSYLDLSAGGTAYYRIKDVDNDGKFKFSNVARIVNGKSSIVLNAFPQPAMSQLTLQHSLIKGTATVTLSTADGRVVSTMRPTTGSMQTQVDMSKLQAGLYVIRFNDGEGNIETMKVIKQ